jgi:hypothetical protein
MQRPERGGHQTIEEWRYRVNPVLITVCCIVVKFDIKAFQAIHLHRVHDAISRGITVTRHNKATKMLETLRVGSYNCKSVEDAALFGTKRVESQ